MAVIVGAQIIELRPQAIGQQPVPGLPDAGNGLRLSRLLCKTRLIAEKGRLEPVKADVASFFEIPNRPDRSEETLVNYILVPSLKMPRLSLTRDERTDIVEHILSLKERE